MPWTEKQRRLFFAQANRGEITLAEAKRRAREGTRPPIKRKRRRRTRR